MEEKSTRPFGLRNFVNAKFEIGEEKGVNKVMSLPEAVRRFVRPGMTLHLGYTWVRPNALNYEVARQFWGKDPGFTVVETGLATTEQILVHGGLVKKIISSYCGDRYPNPAPNPIFQRAYRAGTVQFENWSLLAIVQMVMAGAFGTGFMPTRSVIGSSMEQENAHAFRVLEDPFDNRRKIGLIKALNPDLTLVHGLAADCYGNVVVAPPYGEFFYGAFASRLGAIATVEKIVPPETIRQYSHLVRLPSYRVLAVAEVPFGGHPGGVSNQGVGEIPSYAEDYDFIVEFRQISRDTEKLDQWIKEWVLDCSAREDYLARLGHERLFMLRGKADPESWRYELDGLAEGFGQEPSYSRNEMMIAVACRHIKELVRQKDYHILLAGIGASNLAAWMAAYDLKSQGHDIELVAEVGLFGYLPRPLDPYIFNQRNLPTCRILTDAETVLGLFVGGENNRCIGALGAGQVDKHGNVNSTLIPGRGYLVGSGGGNDVASAAQEVIVLTNQSPTRFLDRVPYITSPGDRVKTLVSDMGLFEKLGDDEEFSLTGYFPEAAATSPEEAIRRIKENCGWELKIGPKVRRLDPPTGEELLMIRLLDPQRLFLEG